MVRKYLVFTLAAIESAVSKPLLNRVQLVGYSVVETGKQSYLPLSETMLAASSEHGRHNSPRGDLGNGPTVRRIARRSFVLP
jgi:hypothetical protein